MNHYTDINALTKILVEYPTNQNEICLWATHIDYLNDKTEGKIGRQVIKKLTENNPDIELKELINDVYIISFSDAEDSLPMWSMYGANGSGIMLKFDFINSDFTKYNMTKCTYKDIDDVVAENQKFINLLKRPAVRIGSNGHDGTLPDSQQAFVKDWAISSISASTVVAPKDKSFHHEDERRLFTCTTPDKIKYRVRNNLLIPYIEEFFPKKVLKEIWIGPTNDVNRIRKSIDLLLKTRGFNDVIIKESSVPYRG